MFFHEVFHEKYIIYEEIFVKIIKISQNKFNPNRDKFLS